MKRILAISIILGAMISIHAQTPLRFSVHVDPQFAWFNSDDETVKPDGSIFHMQAGLQMDYFFAENYAFALGVGINNMGGNLLYADSTEFSSKGETLLVEPGQSVKLNLQYIDIPIGLKLKTEELGYATFFLQLGFNPMINLNAKATSEDASIDKEDIRESVNLFCLGYHAGLGIEYKLGGSTAVIGGIRWTSGLTDVTDNDRANVKLNAISIHMGILF
ncbi:MAG: PorT family protein [Bacteroidales bacterium]|nr:PorT family protein [Bacteroidales bacterium]